MNAVLCEELAVLCDAQDFERGANGAANPCAGHRRRNPRAAAGNTEHKITGDTDWPVFATSAGSVPEQMNWPWRPDHLFKDNDSGDANIVYRSSRRVCGMHVDLVVL
jgi:hypothetical protein